MSIQSTLGNLTKSFKDNIQSALTSAKSAIEGIVGKVSTGFSNIWSGGFAGMSESGMQDLKSQINTYCSDIESQIAAFDETGDITSALKGEVQTAVSDYIAACKELLQAYVSTMRQEIEEADEAYNNYMTAASDIASNVVSDTESVRSNASSIRLD